MIVTIANGAAGSACLCPSWLDHWKNYSGQRTNYCVVRGCGARPEVGGHVREPGAAEENVYVIPLCRACSDKRGQELVIYDGVNLVPIETSETCGNRTKKPLSARFF